MRILMAGPPIIRFSSRNLARLPPNCESVFESGGPMTVSLRRTAIGRSGLNVACWPLSKFQPMRLSIFALCLAFSTSFAAQPEAVPSDAGPLNPSAVEAGKDVVHQLNNAFAKVFETVAPGVVIIETSKKSEISESSPLDDLFFQGPPDENRSRRSPGTPRPVQTEGSGFIVRPDGYILTNVHVIEDADKIDVKLRDGREFPARVVGADERTDIAVIKVDGKDLPVVQLGDSDGVRVGQLAFAIGAPFKLDYTFTYGVISGELIAGHKIVRPWLGIRIETLGDDPSIRELFKSADKGVVVRTIEADAPASKSNLRPFDVITHVDGSAVTSDSQLQHEILKKKVGQNVELTVSRKGQTIKVPVKTGELPDEITRASNQPVQPSEPKPQNVGKFGLQVQELTKDVAERLHLSTQQGVIVTDVEDNSVAAAQGIEREDVTTEVDGKPVTNVQSFREALNKADPKRGVLLYLDRKGSKTFAVLKAGG